MSTRRGGSGSRPAPDREPDPGLVGRFYNAITILRCPHCGALERCAIGRFDRPPGHRCRVCRAAVAAPEGRCCVYCAYGTVPCAEAQSDARLLRLIGLARIGR